MLLTKDHKALEKLRSVVFDARFLPNLDCYTTFRHTGIIKNCPKNMPQKGRIALAGIDHKMHVFRKGARIKYDQLCFKRK